MEVPEQSSPKKLNFKLVVVLFGAAILTVFVIALLFLKYDKHLYPQHTDAKGANRSTLVRPGFLFEVQRGYLSAV